MITPQEIPQPDIQSVRILLRNELGQIVHDITLPLVTTVEVDGKLDHRVTDVDKIVAEHVAMHEERHKVFLAAAQKRGMAAVTPAVEEKDCGCGPK